MGRHHTPQYYLRGFEDPADPGMICVYSRDGDPQSLPIIKVAQSPDYYDDQAEANLADLEGLANPLLDALRLGQPIGRRDKEFFAIYVTTMLTRGPRHRKRGEDLIPQVLESVVDEIRDELVDLATNHPALDPELVERWFEDRYRDRAPATARALLRDPRPSITMVNEVRSMCWRVLYTEPPEFFITSDNPAPFLEGLGLSNSEGELVFPLSPARCLHCSHQPIAGDQDLIFLTIDRRVVREMNRRVANYAVKFVFAHKKATWPQTLIRKRNHYLSRIRWTP